MQPELSIHKRTPSYGSYSEDGTPRRDNSNSFIDECKDISREITSSGTIKSA
jgi:hypothetical protein